MRPVRTAGGVAFVVGLVVVGLGCKSKSSPPPPPAPPSETVVAAMRDYCRIGDMPADKQREAFKLWGWHNGGDPEMGPLWQRAAVKKDPAAIALLRAAAKQALGDRPCAPLEALR